MVFTWTIRNRDTADPIPGAGVVMNNLVTGQSWLAQSDENGVAVVTPLVYPPVTRDETYDSYVVKDGYTPYSLLNTNWGSTSGNSRSIHLTPQATGTWTFVENYRGYDITTLNGRYRFIYAAPWGEMPYNLDSLASAKATIDQVIANPPKQTQTLPLIPIAIGGSILAYLFFVKK